VLDWSCGRRLADLPPRGEMAGKPEGGAGPPTSRSIVMRVLGQPQMTEAAPNGAPSALPGISPTRGIGGFADFAHKDWVNGGPYQRFNISYSYYAGVNRWPKATKSTPETSAEETTTLNEEGDTRDRREFGVTTGAEEEDSAASEDEPRHSRACPR